MFTLFGNRGGNGSNTTFVLGVVALVGSFYFSDGGDSKNAIFLCAAGAVLFGISWFMDRSYYKERLADQSRISEMDSIYRDLDEIRDKIDCCKKSCNARVHGEVDGLNRRIDDEIRDVHCCIKNTCHTSSSTDKCCKKQILNED